MTYELDTFDGNDCDGSELSWVCPKCKHRHKGIGDAHEWLRGDDSEVDVTCDGCDASFVLTISGDWSFHTTAMTAKETTNDPA